MTMHFKSGEKKIKIKTQNVFQFIQNKNTQNYENIGLLFPPHKLMLLFERLANCFSSF